MDLQHHKAAFELLVSLRGYLNTTWTMLFDRMFALDSVLRGVQLTLDRVECLETMILVEHM
jgi:hypothetical protein